MTSLPIATSDWRRDTAEEPVVRLQNRFFEQNPTNLVEGSSLISRPGFKKFSSSPLGVDPSLRIYQQEGIFNDDLFVMKNTNVKKVASSGTVLDITESAYSLNSTDGNRGTFTGGIGDIPPYFYYVGDSTLSVFGETSFAFNTLTRAGTIENNAVVQIGNMYYQFVDTGLDTGAPAGTLANPWKVFRVSGAPIALTMLLRAVMISGIAGTHYSTATQKNTQANFASQTLNTITFFANQGGNLGNGIPVSTSATVQLSWQFPAFTGGGVFSGISQRVTIPTGGGSPEAVATVNGYVVVAMRRDFSTNTSGRFYWIDPGETFIDPLNFATTELLPDSLVSVRVVGDQVWFIGTDTTEVWVTTGDIDFPFRRVQGRTINNGGYPGSDVVIQDSLLLIGSDGVIYSYNGTSQKRLSNNSIEERIRKFYERTPTGYLNDEFRAWSFDSDGHFFYVLNLGRSETLVYDLTTESWSDWTSYNKPYLQQHTGVSWSRFPGAPAICGDVNSGELFFVDPDYKVDDKAGSDSVEVIECFFTCGVPMRMRDTARCNELYITGSVGDPSISITYLTDLDGFYLVDGDGLFLVDFDPAIDFAGDNPNAIRLMISDDNGHTWFSPSDVTADTGNFLQEIVWRSLGHIHAPGRVFTVFDYNALRRIDGVDMR